MNTALISAASLIIVALATAGGGLAASIISKRSEDRVAAMQDKTKRVADEKATALSERTVDREEFDSISRELRQSLKDVRAELDEERAARRAAEEHVREADQRAKDAATEVRTMSRRVNQLEAVMRDAGMTIPPPLYLP